MSTIDIISIYLFHFFYCDIFLLHIVQYYLVNLEVKGVVISEYTASEVI